MAEEPADDTDDVVLAYVRGRLTSEAASRLEAEAALRPDLAAEIALVRGIVAGSEAEARSPAPGEFGWARLSRAIDAEPPRAIDATPPQATAPARARRPLWPLAASAAAAVLVWQLAAVPLMTGLGEPGYAPVSEVPAEFTLEVAFAPDTPEGTIRELLRSVAGRISDGPSAIGLWQLSFASSAARDAAMEALAAAAAVESVQ